MKVPPSPKIVQKVTAHDFETSLRISRTRAGTRSRNGPAGWELFGQTTASGKLRAVSDANPIYLPSDGGLISLVDDRAARIEPADLAAGEALTVIVPGEDVIIADADVPPVRQASRRHQAVRYALEDQLAAPVDTVHLALGPRNGDGTYPAAVVDRESMEAWLTTLGDARTQATSGLVPDYFCLPVPADYAAEVWLMGNRALLRRDANHGLSCEPDLLPAMLASAAEPATLNVRVQADTDADALLDRLRQRGHEINVLDQPDANTLLADLLTGSMGRKNINLLQGTYAPVTAFAKWWRPLRATAILAAAWLILATTVQGLYYYQLQQRYDELHAETRARFRDAFPDVQNINNIWAQAEGEVRQLRAALGTDGLFPLLSATARAVGGVPGLRMHSMQYRNGELYITLRGESIQSLEELRAGFVRSEYASLKIRSAEASDAGVHIRARVSPEES